MVILSQQKCMHHLLTQEPRLRERQDKGTWQIAVSP